MGPSDEDFSYAIENNTIGCNTLRRKNSNNAKEIFGPSESILKAKIVQNKRKIIREDEETDLQIQVIKKFKSITLYVDVFHVIGVAFLVRKSAQIGHHIAVLILNKDADHFITVIDEMRTE